MPQRIFVQSLNDYVSFPDDWSDEQISGWVRSQSSEPPDGGSETDLLGALQHGAKKIIPLAQQGFANQAKGVFNMLPYPDWAERKPRQFIERQLESSEDKLRRLEREFTPDTLPEKIAAGVAEAPGQLASIAVPAAVAGTTVAAAPFTGGASLAVGAAAGAAGLGVPAFFRGWGESDDVIEGLKSGAIGGAEGAAFGTVGYGVGAITNPLKRRLAHALGGGAIGGTSAAAQGADAEDIAASAATMFTLSAAMPSRARIKDKALRTLEDAELYKARETIVYKEPGLLSKVPALEEAKLWTQEKVTNIRARLMDATDKIIADRSLEVMPPENPNYLGARNATAAASQVRAGVKEGFADTLDPRIPRTKSIEEIHGNARPTNPAERNGTDWTIDHDAYLLANRVKEVRDRGIEFKGYSEKPELVISALKRKYSPETIAKWDQSQAEVNNIGNFAVDMLQRSGEFTAKESAAIKNSKNWVALERYFENTGDTRTNRKQGTGGKIIHKLKGGSGQDILNPYVGVMSLMERAYVRANQNYYLDSLFSIFEESATPSAYFKPVRAFKFVRGLPKRAKSKVEQKTLDSIDKHTKIKEVTKVPGEQVKKQGALTPRERFNDAENIITFKRGGKTVSYQVEPKLYNELRMGERYNVPRPFEIIMGGPKKMATLGYTGLNPGFSIFTNPQRDLFSSMLQSKDPGVFGMKHLARLWETTVGRARERGEGPITETAKRYRASGAPIAGPVEADMSLGLSLRDQVINNSERFGFARNLVKHPVETLREITGMSENLNRLPEYLAAEKMYGAGTPDAHIAGMAWSKDVSLDFSRMGEYTRWANESIPFFNAAFQGASKFARTMKERPVAATLQGMSTITAPMMGLWWLNKDEKWYQELPTWEKTLFAHIKFGDGPIWRIPLPFEWGILFGSLPVATADAAYQKDPSRFKDGVDQALKTLFPDFVPQFVKPIAEVWAGEDLFKGRKLESESMKRRLPEERYRETTPTLYRGVGSALGVSPVKVQHLAESYTGGLIKEPVNMIDFLAGKDVPGGVPFASRLVSSQDRQGQSVDDFYKQKEEMGQAWTSAKKRQESGDIIGARRILEDNAEVLGLDPGRIAFLMRTRKWTIPDRMKRFNKIATQMSGVRKRKGEASEITTLARLALGRN